MYGTTWCGDCHRAKAVLDAKGISYEFINIEDDTEAAAIVQKINQGQRSVPTIVFPDESVLVEPSNQELTNKVVSLYHDLLWSNL